MERQNGGHRYKSRSAALDDRLSATRYLVVPIPRSADRNRPGSRADQGKCQQDGAHPEREPARGKPSRVSLKIECSLHRRPPCQIAGSDGKVREAPQGPTRLPPARGDLFFFVLEEGEVGGFSLEKPGLPRGPTGASRFQESSVSLRGGIPSN